MDSRHPISPISTLAGKTNGRQRYSGVAILLGFALLVCIAYEAIAISLAVQKGRELEESPITYDIAQPDKQEYFPGELIHFTNARHVSPTKTQPLPILLFTLDSFENIETGEVFPGTQAARIVREIGDHPFHATRRIPADASPGIYVFEGLGASQSSRLARATPYTSQPFRVLPTKPVPPTPLPSK